MILTQYNDADVLLYVCGGKIYSISNDDENDNIIFQSYYFSSTFVLSDLGDHLT